MNNSLTSFMLAIGMTFLLFACGAKHETTSTLTVEASASGPFFSGPNSLISEVNVDLSSMKNLEKVTENQLVELLLSKVSVNLNDGAEENFSGFNNASLQIVSGSTEMKTLAILNPIETNSKGIILNIGEDAELTEYFKSDTFSLVLDLDFKEDNYADEFGVVLDLDLAIKHN